MDDKQLMADITASVTDLDEQVRGIASESQRRYRMGIPAGQTVRAFGEFEPADDEARAGIRAACQAAYEGIMAKVDRHIDAINRDMTAPASADDVATVSFTLARENVTRAELQALLDRYRDNHQLAAGIIERAHRSDIYLDGEPAHVRVYRDDADRAARHVFDRYDGRYDGRSAVMGAGILAEDVVHALRHVDMFGMRY